MPSHQHAWCWLYTGKGFTMLGINDFLHAFYLETTSFIIIYDISGDLVSLRALSLPLWYKDQTIPRKMSQYNTADVLGPCVARPPVAIVLTMSEKRVFLSSRKRDYNNIIVTNIWTVQIHLYSYPMKFSIQRVLVPVSILRSSFHVWDAHVKDKTVTRPSYV